MAPKSEKLSSILWQIARRPDPPVPWQDGGNLPWNDAEFSQRMLAEHLDQSHGAASRTDPERERILSWLWQELNLKTGDNILDFTCGPGLYAVDLAQKGCLVTGIDFSPASIAYARRLAAAEGVAACCTFIEQDVREVELEPASFDAALFLYGQMAVFRREEAAALLQKIAAALRPGGRLIIELLNQDRVDKEHSTWWFTDDKGLWGSRPFLHLGERYWMADEQLSVERFYIIDLESKSLTAITLCDQTYAADEMATLLESAGFASVESYPEWAGLDLYDRKEWIAFCAEK